MSILNTEKILLEFLKNSESQVVALKGSWGSGKTYFWNEFLKKHKENKDLGFKKYAYCSLFGIESLQELKYSIFENSIPRNNLGEDINIDNIHENLERLSKKSFSILRNLPAIKDYANLGWWFLNTKEESLICIDDFERMSEKLGTSNLLGIISELKEKRKCRIVLIFNEEKLTRDSLSIYKQFKEKVIDIDIEFSPSPEECSEKAFKDYKNPESCDAVLFNYAVKLKITNIRILKKIKNITELIIPHLRQHNPLLLQQTLSSLSLLVYSYYGNPINDIESEIPSTDYIVSYSPFGDILGRKEKIEHEEKWGQILSFFGWTHTDEFDLELLATIKRGYILEETFKKVALSSSKSLDAGDIQKKYSEVWTELYHVGFIDNENEFVTTFRKLFKEDSLYLDISNLNEVVHILRELDKIEEASEIIDSFIHNNKVEPEKLKISDQFGFRFHLNKPLDDEIKKKFIEFYQEKTGRRTLSEVLDGIIERNYSYGSEEEEIIFKASTEDITTLFSGLTGTKFQEYRRILLKYKDVTNPGEGWKKTTEKTFKALRTFGTSKINKLRLKSYGIEL